MANGDDIYRKMTLRELFHEWNESNNIVPPRAEIRRRFGWHKGGPELWDLIESFVLSQNGMFEPEPSPFDMGGHQPIPPPPVNYDFAAMLKQLNMTDGVVEPTHLVADQMVDSGWDGVDGREYGKRFDRSPEDILTYLHDLQAQDLYMDDLTESQHRYFIGIFKAWRHWVRNVRGK
jgi:hypothetical protein